MEVKVPLRLDIAGSYTDLPQYRKDGAHVVLPLDYYVRASGGMTHDVFVNKMSDRVARELGVRKLDVQCVCELVHGSGLGASSATTVALIRFYSEFYHLEIHDTLVQIAIRIIARMGVVGRQDEYCATFGKPLYLQYKGAAVTVHELELPPAIKEEVEKWHLVYVPRTVTGQAMLRYEVDQKFDSREIVRLTGEICYAIEGNDFPQFWSLYLDHWKIVEEQNPLKINEDILQLRTQFPDLYIRPCGAGGGGYVLIHGNCPLNDRIVHAVRVL